MSAIGRVGTLTAGLENLAALGDADIWIHPEPEALDKRREMPRVDPQAIDRGLAADGIEPRPVKKSRAQGMVRQCLVQPRDRGRSMRQGRCDGRKIDRVGIRYSDHEYARLIRASLFPL
jgi:hypothetical protein